MKYWHWGSPPRWCGILTEHCCRGSLPRHFLSDCAFPDKVSRMDQFAEATKTINSIKSDIYRYVLRVIRDLHPSRMGIRGRMPIVLPLPAVGRNHLGNPDYNGNGSKWRSGDQFFIADEILVHGDRDSFRVCRVDHKCHTDPRDQGRVTRMPPARMPSAISGTVISRMVRPQVAPQNRGAPADESCRNVDRRNQPHAIS